MRNPKRISASRSSPIAGHDGRVKPLTALQLEEVQGGAAGPMKESMETMKSDEPPQG